MRYLSVEGFKGVEYGNILHSHSHLAFLGWMYGSLYSLLVYQYIPSAKLRFYNDLFWFSQVSVLGMVITFALQGYSLLSITFSSLHMLLAYFFTIKFYKHTRHEKREPELLFALTSLILMALSTLGPWSLGIVGALKAGSKELMDLLINFYLHFQINGWFLFALIGIVLKQLKGFGADFKQRNLKYFYLLMAISVLPAYSLSAVWVVNYNWLFKLAMIAASFQLAAVIFFIYEIYRTSKTTKNISGYYKKLLLFILFLFIGKNGLQLMSVIPEFALVISKIRLLVIGYLHLVLLGICSLLVIVSYSFSGFIKETKLIKSGFLFLLFGFFSTEILIFLQAFFYIKQWGNIIFFNYLMFGFSVFLPVGAFITFIAPILQKKEISSGKQWFHKYPVLFRQSTD